MASMQPPKAIPAPGQFSLTGAEPRCHGVSLLELLVTLAVAGVLMGTALPAFVELGADHRATAGINAMLGAVRATRHLAITHNAPATLCAGQGPRCLGANRWHEGRPSHSWTRIGTNASMRASWWVFGCRP